MDEDARSRWDMRPILAALRPIMFRWDAIGLVEEFPEDEYDCVVFPVLRQLQNGADVDELAAWLGDFAKDHFGVISSPKADRRAAAELMRWWRGPSSPRVAGSVATVPKS